MDLYGVQFLPILRHSILHSPNDIESQTDHKSSAFDTFFLLKKYYNNVISNLDVDLVTNSNNFHFMVILTTHIRNTTKKHNMKKTQQNTIPKLKPK
jgi:hypothetical protein